VEMYWKRTDLVKTTALGIKISKVLKNLILIHYYKIKKYLILNYTSKSFLIKDLEYLK